MLTKNNRIKFHNMTCVKRVSIIVRRDHDIELIGRGGVIKKCIEMLLYIKTVLQFVLAVGIGGRNI